MSASSLHLVEDPRDLEAPARPPAEQGKTIEGEIMRSPTECVRVSTCTYDGLELIELSVWRVRSDRNRWFRASVLRVAPHEVADLVIALLSGARRVT
ncbi:MAG: hypothetical protein IT377_27765 [Polyangiaceae bacterium]|nr:hypothetical protein [Polyangiaceae bacterium]